MDFKGDVLMITLVIVFLIGIGLGNMIRDMEDKDDE